MSHTTSRSAHIAASQQCPWLPLQIYGQASVIQQKPSAAHGSFISQEIGGNAKLVPPESRILVSCPASGELQQHGMDVHAFFKVVFKPFMVLTPASAPICCAGTCSSSGLTSICNPPKGQAMVLLIFLRDMHVMWACRWMYTPSP